MAILPVAAAGTLGNLATLPNIPTWYAGLVKPSFNPPNWVFGPVWTVLYIAMAYAFFRILRLRPAPPDRNLAIAMFFIQIVLNAAWSFAFFAAHSPALGLGVVALLWLSVLATLVVFWQADRLAGLLFVPYLAWVSFAALLNVAIWRLNG